MKPILIYVETNKDGKLEMTKEQFEQFMQEAFNQGYEAGLAKGTIVYPSITNPTPYTPPSVMPSQPWYTPLTCVSGGSESVVLYTKCNKNNEINIYDIEVGNSITFGSYWQGLSKSEGKTPIEWRILAKDGNKALLISEYALDSKPYNDGLINTTWEHCTLRRWLNNDFLNNAFTAEEKQVIQSTYVTADRNSEYSTSPGNSTTDKVFLLSINEAEKYFHDNEDRMCVPTTYAKASGGWTGDSHTKNGKPTCWWWLRSPGSLPNRAADVNRGGGVICGGDRVGCDLACVRPALWITLNS